MLSRMTSTELSHWMAYEHVTGPIGPARDEILTGIIASTQVNSSMGKGGKRTKPEDFIPQWDGKKPQTVDEQLAIVKQLNSAFGGVDETKENDI